MFESSRFTVLSIISKNRKDLKRLFPQPSVLDKQRLISRILERSRLDG